MSKRLAFVINTKYCNDCKACEIACKMERKLDIGTQWRKVRNVVKVDSSTTDAMNGNLNKTYDVSMSCNHCEEPQCVVICPVNAYKKMSDGIVIQDYDLCIGCTKCVGACPYSAPVYNYTLKKSSKCDLCYERLLAGLPAACVNACPSNALMVMDYETAVARYGESQDLTPDDSNVVPSATTNPSIVIVK